MSTSQTLITVLIVAAVTLGTRLCSFVLFPSGKKAPAFITWLSGQLPRAVMAMLVIYCIKDVRFTTVGQWLPTLLSVGITAALHLWKRQMMISIPGGTIAYMLLIRLLG